MSKLPLLVGCEFSQVVTAAFRRHKVEAYSCDLLPTDGNPAWHIQGDLKKVLSSRKWAGLIVFPSCTYLCNSGVRWLYNGGSSKNGIDCARWDKMVDAVDFFLWLRDRPGPKCIENPVMHGHAKDIMDEYGWPTKPTQYVHPWMFGHPETKQTGLWLDQLPTLTPTKIVKGRAPRVHFESPGSDRWRRRSKTLPGIAEAMASQWAPIFGGV